MHNSSNKWGTCPISHLVPGNIWWHFQQIGLSIWCYTQMLLGGQSYGSCTSCLLCSAHVKEYYTTDASGRMLLSIGIGTIAKYVWVTVHLKSSRKILPTQLSFAQINWLDEDQERFRLYPAPIEIWSPTSSMRTFIPVGSIITCVALMKTKDNCDSETLVIIPLHV